MAIEKNPRVKCPVSEHHMVEMWEKHMILRGKFKLKCGSIGLKYSTREIRVEELVKQQGRYWNQY